MLPKKFIAGFAVGVSATIGMSHYVQLSQIEERNEEIRETIGEARGTTRQDIHLVLKKINCELTYGGGCEWILGDFEVRNGEARCGGIAKAVALEAARYGFDSQIELEINEIAAHYYTLLSRDGETYRIDGTPPNLRFQQIK